jgi:hypothetical protein
MVASRSEGGGKQGFQGMKVIKGLISFSRIAKCAQGLLENIVFQRSVGRK